MKRAATILALLLSLATGGAATLEVGFQPVHGNGPLLLDSLRYRGAGGETYSVTRFSFLLSGFALEKSEGGWVELPGQYASMDAAARRLAATLNDVPPGTYRALRFALGPDADGNAGDPARWPAGHPLNPDVNGMHWSWQGGYIFLAMEGHFRVGESDARGWSWHFARDVNRTIVTLPLDVRLGEKDSASVRISFDLATLFNAPRPVSMARDGDSTHSRDGDPISDALRANLPSAFQVREIASSAPEVTALPVKPLYMPATYTPYRLRISAKFPVPALPRDNPLLVERVELGAKLFNEQLLSRTGAQSCATCHDASHAFADPHRYSLGVDGQSGTRNAMPLFDLAWKSSFFWDGRAPSLRAQALMPIQDHAEMDEKLDRVVAKLKATEAYPTLFARAFDSKEITPERIGLALENFLLTLTSRESRLDRAMRGEAELSPEEKRGFELFFTEYEPRSGHFGADCFHCHGGAQFSDRQFHNNGLGDAKDAGLFRVTSRDADRGKFSTPSLRNVALTAPYMHDGRFESLEDVVAHYDHGVKRDGTLDPNLAKHPPEGLRLSAEDQRALVAFLRTLTDESLVAAPQTARNP